MKKQSQSDFQESVANVLRSDLGWPVDSNELILMTSGVANFVYSFSVEDQQYFVKFFPQFFRSNELVAKPEGSYFRESLIYDLALRQNYLGVPELVHKSTTLPLLVTKKWGSTNMLEVINTLSFEELIEKVKLVLLSANEFKKFINNFDRTFDFDKNISIFSELQKKYLIANPLEKIKLNLSDVDLFWKDYSSLSLGLVFGDLSLKNVLVDDNRVCFCDFESMFVAPSIFDICYFFADVLNILDKDKYQEFTSQIFQGPNLQLSDEEHRMFFRLLAVCISYRSSNRLQTSSSNVLDIAQIQSIFYM